jgi:hypothetical protein
MLTIDYFNPVVDDWTPDCMAEEIKQRESCDFVLYVITPEMTGVYSIAEVTDDSNKRPEKTIFCFLTEPIITDFNGTKFFDAGQFRSLTAVGKMIEKNGGKWCTTLGDVANYVNKTEEENGRSTE